MTLEQPEARKLVFGMLLAGASALPAGSVISGLLAGMGGNWVAEAVGGVVAAGPPPGTALTAAFARAVQAAATDLRREYGDERVRRDGQDAFRLLRDTARSTTAVQAPPGAADIIVVQRSLAGALGQLLHGFPDGQVKLLREHLLAATARAFQEELARDGAAWRLYHGWLLERMLLQNTALQAALADQPVARAQLGDAAAIEERLDSFAERLDALLAELRSALIQAATAGQGSSGVRQVARVGDQGRIERHTQRVERSEGPIEQVQEGGHGAVINDSSQIVTGARKRQPERPFSGQREADQKPRDPPPIALRLTLRPTAAGAEIDWEALIIGRRTSAFHSPFSGPDLALVLRALDLCQYPSASLTADELRRLEARGLPVGPTGLADDGHRAVGRALFDALVADQVAATALSTIRDYATAEGRALSLHLHFPGAAQALAALPWELLWPDEARPLLLSGTQPVTLTRHLDLAQAVPSPRPGGRPLLLRAVMPEAGMEPDVQVEAQRAARRAWEGLAASGDITVLPELRPATRTALTEAARTTPADILHFVGHGAMVDGEGYLILDSPDGTWDRAPISRLLPALAGTRVAVFAACQGAAVSADEGGGVLSATGVPVVIGMQLTVRSEAAARISTLLYAELAAGRSVQAALWAARLALFTEEPDGASWYVSALYVRARDDGEAWLLG